jgi:hypothetical protein
VLKVNKSPEAVSSTLHVLNAYTKNMSLIEKNILERKVADLVNQYNRLKEEK